MPRLAMATAPGRRAASSPSRNATSFSSSSLKRVAAPSPTIARAPVAWCRCVRMYLTTERSAGFATSLSSDSRAWLSECSISVLTQESGPRSKSVTGLAAIISSLAPQRISRLFFCVPPLQLETRHGALQLLGHRREVADRSGRLLRAARRLPRDLEDVLHVLRDLVGGVGLRLRGRGDLRDQRGEVLRHRVDLGERLARGVGELRALDHALRRFLHG